MLSVIYILFSILLIFIIIELFISITNIKNKEDFIKNNNLGLKFNNLSFIKKIEFYINYLSKYNNKIIYFRPFIIIIISCILSIIIGFVSFKLLDVFSSALIISIYSFFIPYIILANLYNNYRKKIIETFPTYILSLKNYTKISNDIIIAMKNVKVEYPLSIFTNKFNILIEKGITVYEAFEKLKNDINISKISEFISAIQNCYLNGGDFSNLLDKYSKIINKINIQREREKQDNFTSILVLIILAIINIFLIIKFIYANTLYKNIITTTFIGNCILNINILSYLLIFYFIKKLNKLED